MPFLFFLFEILWYWGSAWVCIFQVHTISASTLLLMILFCGVVCASDVVIVLRSPKGSSTCPWVTSRLFEGKTTYKMTAADSKGSLISHTTTTCPAFWGHRVVNTKLSHIMTAFRPGPSSLSCWTMSSRTAYVTRSDLTAVVDGQES